jgi:hypothetical protein
VTVPEEVVDDLLAREIEDVDGVDVEELRAVEYVERDPRIDALETAVALNEAGDRAARASTLVERARHELRAVWAAVVGEHGVEAIAGDGPEEPWLVAFGTGVASGGAGAGAATDGDDEVAWAAVGQDRRVLLAGRDGVPFRPRERRVLELLARLAAEH